MMNLKQYVREALLLTGLIVSFGCTERSPYYGDAGTAAPAGDAAFTDGQMGGTDGGINPYDFTVDPLDATPSPLASLRLNEVQCRGEEWVEVFNIGETPVELDGLYLTDRPNEQARHHQLGEGATLGAGEFLVVGELPFGVSCEDDVIALMDERGYQLDQVTMAATQVGATYGRLPDGLGDWSATSATPGASNAPVDPPQLRLNEIDCHGRDRVEIVNVGTNGADLQGFRIRDDAGNQYELAGDLAPGDWLVVRRQTEEQAGFTFGIACDQETVSLVDPNDEVVDSVALERTVEAFTWGRLPDGSGEWQPTSPTLGEMNQAPRAPADDLFRTEEIPTIDLYLDEGDIADLGQEPREWVVGGFRITDRGEESELREAGIRLKGRIGSFRPLGEKSGFKIRFDLDDRERFRGLKRMTLNNMVQDRSKIAEWTAYKIFRAMGLPAPRVGYVWVRLNDEPYGLYAHIETPDELFMKRWFWSTDHVYEGAYGQDLIPDRLDDLQVDQGEPDAGESLRPLLELIERREPNQLMQQGADLLDWPAVIGVFAVELYIGHWDGYAPTRNNYYIHLDDEGRATWMPWGTDQTFRQQRDLRDGRGLMFSACLEDVFCSLEYDRTIIRLMEVIDGLNLEEELPALAERLRPQVEADERIDVNRFDSEVEATLRFLRQRRERTTEVYECLLSEQSDPDGDGIPCGYDCGPEDAGVFPGAEESCGDQIDQDCDGRIDEGRACPDCRAVFAGRHRYLVCPERRPAERAGEWCGQYGALPASLETEFETRWLRTQARLLEDQPYWIGLSDGEREGRFVWASGADSEFTSWSRGEPNGGDRENCVAMDLRSGNWFDAPCAGLNLGILCEDPCDLEVDGDDDGFSACAGDCDDQNPEINPDADDICGDGIDQDCSGQPDDGGNCECVGGYRGGQLYLFCSDGRSWPEAQRRCREREMDLVSFDDVAEADWVSERVAQSFNRDYWIGLSDRADEGEFVWVDGEERDLERWNNGEPNNAGNNEDCAHVWMRNWTWNDRPCNARLQYVCEEACTSRDEDGDEHDACDGDCDDRRGGVHPGAQESCDGVDQDCDGRVDEGARCGEAE